MNFNILDGIDFIYISDLKSHCLSAERNARVDPYGSTANARSALELLMKGLLKSNGLKCGGNGVLVDMIKTCLNAHLFMPHTEDAGNYATFIRQYGNGTLHVADNSSRHIVNKDNLADAMAVLESLYEVVRIAFGIETPFDPDKVPFRDYEILRTVRKFDGEVICGDFNYFVCKNGNKSDTYYLQCFPLNTEEESVDSLIERSEEARQSIRNDRKRRAYLLDPQNIVFPEGSDRRLVLYGIHSDSFLLSENRVKMSVRQAMQVGLDLVLTLQELRAVSDGIHHRHINPGCIIITPDRDSYMAYLVNMQTAKIVNSDGTIVYGLSRVLESSLYIPDDVRSFSSEKLLQVDWEQVDVYSVAKIMLYCVDPALTAGRVDIDSLYDYGFNDSQVCFFEDILTGSTVGIPKLDKVQEMLEYELSQS